MRLDHAGDDVAPLGLGSAGGDQHGVGLADARRGAQEDLQAPAPVSPGAGEQRLGRGPSRWFSGHGVPLRPHNLLGCGIEREIELKDVNPWLAEKAEGAALDMRGHQRPHALLGQAAGLGDARHLQQRRRGRDVRVEAAGRRRHGIDGDRPDGTRLAQGVHVALHAIEQLAA